MYKYAPSGNHEAEPITVEKTKAERVRPRLLGAGRAGTDCQQWAILILTALADGPMHNGALLRKIGGVSQKMLTQTLRDLECNGLVARKTLQTVPPHVEYRLTNLGKSLSRALHGLDRWAECNFPRLDAARAQHLAGASLRRRR